jgi:hypothetical protein
MGGMKKSSHHCDLQDAEFLVLIEPGGMSENAMNSLARAHGELGVRALVFPDERLHAEWRERLAALT